MGRQRLHFDTCQCVVTYDYDENTDKFTLVTYDRKCPYHTAMNDTDGWNELLTSHASKALVLQTLEAQGVVAQVTFGTTPVKRAIVVNDAGLTPAGKTKLQTALQGTSGDNPIYLGSTLVRL